MTHLVSYHSARAATAIVSTAAFGAVFFEPPAGAVLGVVLLCLSMLLAAALIARQRRRSLTELAVAVAARPRPLLATAIDGAASLPRRRIPFM